VNNRKSRDLYFGATSKSRAKAPPWALPDQEVKKWIEEWVDDGFIKDYLNYAMSCGITPSVYHVGTVITTVSYALCNCEITVRGFKEDSRGEIAEQQNRDNRIVPVMWSAIIGESGDRKSTAMDFGKRILKEAVKGTDNEHGEAPDFASPEALTEHMAEHGPVFTFRDELSTILTTAKRPHLEHMKSTLLLIYEHTSLKRRKAKDTSKNHNEEEGPVEAYQVMVEKPIKMILGCIPPRVFAKQTSVDDWDTGLLPRFIYWPGFLDVLATKITSFGNNPEIELELSRHLRKYFLRRKKAGLHIIVPYDVNYEISSWIRARIDTLRGRVSGALYAYLKRSYATVIRIAAILAAGELAHLQGSHAPIYVGHDHASGAIELLDMINPRLLDLFEHTKRDRVGTREEALLAIIVEAKEGITIDEILSRMDDAPSRSLIAKEIKNLQKTDDVICLNLPKAIGKPPGLYFTSKYKTAVRQRIYAEEQKIAEHKREKSKIYKRKQRATAKLKPENMETKG